MRSYQAHLYSSIRRKVPHPTSRMARERLPFCARPCTFRSSTTRTGLAFASSVVTLCRKSWRMLRMRRCKAQHSLLVVAGENCSLSLLPCLRIPLYYHLLLLPRELLRTALQKPQGLPQRFRSFNLRSIRQHSIAPRRCPQRLPVLGPSGVRDLGAPPHRSGSRTSDLPLGRWSPRGCGPSRTEGAPGVCPSAPWCGPCRCEYVSRRDPDMAG